MFKGRTGKPREFRHGEQEEAIHSKERSVAAGGKVGSSREVKKSCWFWALRLRVKDCQELFRHSGRAVDKISVFGLHCTSGKYIISQQT